MQEAVSFPGANLNNTDNLEVARLLDENPSSCPGTDVKSISEE